MAIRAKDIYEGRKKSRSHIGVIITVILAIIVVAVLIFYGLRNYCVYDENGNATLVLPFSKQAQNEEVTQSPEESPIQSPEDSAVQSPTDSTAESPMVSPLESPVASSEVSPNEN